MSERENIASRLKEARVLAGLSQAQAAVKMGLQRPAITEIESANRKVSAEEILQFADLYKVSSSWLLGTVKPEEEESEQFQFAARELSKLKPEDIKKVFDILKILPK